MPFCSKRKIAFIHIPKTGGTSIEYCLGLTGKENFFFDNWGLDRPGFIREMGRLTSSPRIQYEPQHYDPGLMSDLVPGFDSYFTFTFVRNPYTRLLSEFHYDNRIHLEFTEDFDPARFHDWSVGYLERIDWSHKEPQTTFTNHRLDFIGRFERLEEDFHELKARLSLFNPAYFAGREFPLQKLNHTGVSKTALIPMILPETRVLIEEVYADDFEKLGYGRFDDAHENKETRGLPPKAKSSTRDSCAPLISS